MAEGGAAGRRAIRPRARRCSRRVRRRRSVRPPLVHGHRGAPEELRGHAPGARGRARRRDGLRRLVDHGLQRDRGVGHGRDPRSGDVPAHAREASYKVGRMICDVVTPDGEALPGDPSHVLRLALERMEAWASTPSTSAPSSSTSSSRTTRDGDPGRGRVLRHDDMDAASDLRHDTVGALEAMGIPIEYVHHEVGPSQHEIDMQFLTPLHGRPHDHLPARGQGDRQEGRLPRDVHAEADLRGERLGDAHASVPLRATARTPSSTPTTSGASRTSARASSPGSSATPARSRRSSPSG